AGGVDEHAEVAIGHRRAVDPEGVNGHSMNRSLFRIVPVRPHAERAARYEDHVGRVRRRMRGARSRRCNLTFAHGAVAPQTSVETPAPEARLCIPPEAAVRKKIVKDATRPSQANQVTQRGCHLQRRMTTTREPLESCSDWLRP